jgi:hypothetical protein
MNSLISGLNAGQAASSMSSVETMGANHGDPVGQQNTQTGGTHDPTGSVLASALSASLSGADPEGTTSLGADNGSTANATHTAINHSDGGHGSHVHYEHMWS